MVFLGVVKVADKAFGDGVGIFLENAGIILSGVLDAIVDATVVHHVGLEEYHGAQVATGGEEVSAEDAGVFVDAAGEGAVVGEAGHPGDIIEGFGDGGAEGYFFVVDALDKAEEHFEALVIGADFAEAVGSVAEDVVVVFVAEGGAGGVAPFFGVHVEAENEIGFDDIIDEAGAIADFL